AKVVRVRIDERAIGRYLECTPASVRFLVERVKNGASPRELLLSGEVSPGLLEAALSAIARRGAIEAVEREDGAVPLVPPGALGSGASRAAAVEAPRRAAAAVEAPRPAAVAVEAPRPAAAAVEAPRPAAVAVEAPRPAAAAAASVV